jgi:hypothetical protein
VGDPLGPIDNSAENAAGVAEATDKALEEFFRSGASLPYLLEHHGRVLDPLRGGTVQWEMWPYMKGLTYLLQKHRKLVILKARQLGVTWLMASFAVWLATFNEGANILIISIGQDESAAVLDRCRFILDHLPWKIQRKKDNESEITFPELRSKIRALPATAAAGRGETATAVIADEYAHQEYAAQNYAASKPTIDAGGWFIAISTANGLDNPFSTLFEEADGFNIVPTKAGLWLPSNGKAGPNGFLPVFLRWDARPDRNDKWYAQQRREFNSDYVRQEYPSNPREAFLVSGRPVFDNLKLADLWLLSDPRTTARASVPDYFADLGAKLTIWELPNPKKRYFIGVDVAEGVATDAVKREGDNSVIQIIDAENWDQVAEFSTNQINPEELAEVIHRLAWYYRGLVAVERNGHGWATLQRLVMLHSVRPSQYHLYHDRRSPINIPGPAHNVTRVGKVGWITSRVSKPIIISGLEAAVRLGHFSPKSRELIGEMMTYQRKEDGTTAAQKGKKDDRVMATAIALEMAKEIQHETEQTEGGIYLPRPMSVEGGFIGRHDDR